MPFQQDIDSARAEKIGTHGVTQASLDDTLRRAEAALEWVRAAHAKSTLPLLRFPARTDDLDAIAKAAARLRAGATDVVVLGVGGSSLGGQTLAQLAGVGVRGIEAFRKGPRLHFLDNLDPATYAALLDALPLATTRFIAISKSGGTGETLMQTAAALAAVKAAGLSSRVGELFVGISESARPGKQNGLRDLLGSSVQMLEHDPGVGGRYSALTNVGLLPAAVLGLDIKAIRAGAAMAFAPVLARRPAAEVPAAARGRPQCRGRGRGQEHRRADGLCRQARALCALVHAALGREPRQGRQGNDPGRRARAGRPAFAAAAVHRRPARQAVHRNHGRNGRARARASRRISRSYAASRISPAGPSAISWRRRGAPPPRRSRAMDARCAPCMSRRSTRRASVR